MTRAHIAGEIFSTGITRSGDAFRSGRGHSEPLVCDCAHCAERIGISLTCMRNSIVLSGALWLVLIGITLGVLKIFN